MSTEAVDQGGDIDMHTPEEMAKDADVKTEEADDELEIEYHDDGKIPIFKPTMDQFKNFEAFIKRVNPYGMQSGIVKVIPPKEWLESQPPLDKEKLQSIVIQRPIEQEFMGGRGEYKQINVQKSRTYNLMQWHAICRRLGYRTPVARGERGQNTVIDSVRPKRTVSQPTPAKAKPTTPRRRGRPRKSALKADEDVEILVDKENEVATSETETRVSTPSKLDSNSAAAAAATPCEPLKSGGRQPAARQRITRIARDRSPDGGDAEDPESGWDNFNHRIDTSGFTLERCKELETTYWKSVSSGNPMYGADMPGSLFDDSTKSWNVAHLENILDYMTEQVDGVNSAYLYLGMWKATFAWHVEDVDLYSINYIHFGAPKQWYSISQADNARFERAMKAIYPQDAKSCPEFLRHKMFLTSPAKLQEHGVKVNRLIHREGEFVITFPYGYHSGYNLGYNCAESVNFAFEDWLDIGKKATKCSCPADQNSPWVNAYDLEQNYYGWSGMPTPESLEDEDEDEAEPDGADQKIVVKKPKKIRMKMERKPQKTQGFVPLKIHLKLSKTPPCILCPRTLDGEELIATSDGRKAHRLCSKMIPETYIEKKDGIETVMGVANVPQDRYKIKCQACRSSRGAGIQCSVGKCSRGYHPCCALERGVEFFFWDEKPTADGVENLGTRSYFRCKFHRTRRPKDAKIETLQEDEEIRSYAHALQTGDCISACKLGGDIFGCTVLENNFTEQTLTVSYANNLIMELPYYLIMISRSNEVPIMPTFSALNIVQNEPPVFKKRRKNKDAPAPRSNGLPRQGDAFGDPALPQVWEEFDAPADCTSKQVTPIDFSLRPIWHFIFKGSTETKANFCLDPKNPVPNVAAHSDLQAAKDQARVIKPSYTPRPLANNKPRTPLPYAAPANFNHTYTRPYNSPSPATPHLASSQNPLLSAVYAGPPMGGPLQFYNNHNVSPSALTYGYPTPYNAPSLWQTSPQSIAPKALNAQTIAPKLLTPQQGMMINGQMRHPNSYPQQR